MPAKMIALYKAPQDLSAFMKHYTEIHTPLVLAYPGLEKLEVTEVKRNLMAKELPYVLIAEMTFKDMETLKAALKSPQGEAVGKDLMGFAGDLATVLLTEDTL